MAKKSKHPLDFVKPGFSFKNGGNLPKAQPGMSIIGMPPADLGFDAGTLRNDNTRVVKPFASPLLTPEEQAAIAKAERQRQADRAKKIAERKAELDKYYSQPGLISGVKNFKPDTKEMATAGIDYEQAVKEDPIGTVGVELALGLLPEAAPLIKRAYNTVATGESFLPVAWKSPAVGLTQSASDDMFRAVVNSGKLTPEERALVLEYQSNSRPFTGRGYNIVNENKRQALNNIINKYKTEIGDDVVLTRMFSNRPDALGATLENGILNFGDRPTSFTAGIGSGLHGTANNRLVVPRRYSKQMGDNFLVNQYDKPSEDVLRLLDEDTKGFASWLGSNANLEAERELIGTGLNFKQIGKVKNDLGGYDHIVKPIKKPGGVIDDPAGQWAHPGKVTRIPSNQITMKGVNYPVLGIDNTGYKQMMMPGGEYTFPGTSVTEYPIKAQTGKPITGNERVYFPTLPVDMWSQTMIQPYLQKNVRTYANPETGEPIVNLPELTIKPEPSPWEELLRRGDGITQLGFSDPVTIAAGAAAGIPALGIAGVRQLIGALPGALNANIANVPGASINNLINASAITGSGMQVANPNSALWQSIGQAATDPNANTLSNAAYETAFTGLGFLGMPGSMTSPVKSGFNKLTEAANYIPAKLSGTLPRYINPNFARNYVKSIDPLITKESLNLINPGYKDVIGGTLTGASAGLAGGLLQTMFPGEKITEEERLKQRKLYQKKAEGKITIEEDQWLKNLEAKRIRIGNSAANSMLASIGTGALFGLGYGIGARNKDVLRRFMAYGQDFPVQEESVMASADPARHTRLLEARNAYWGNRNPNTFNTIIEPDQKALLRRYGVGQEPLPPPPPEQDLWGLATSQEESIRQASQAEHFSTILRTTGTQTHLLRDFIDTDPNWRALADDFVSHMERNGISGAREQLNNYLTGSAEMPTLFSNNLGFYNNANRPSGFNLSRNQTPNYVVPTPRTTPNPRVVNRSGLTKEQVLQKATSKDKEVLSKMTDQEFQSTVLKPTGEVVSYELNLASPFGKSEPPLSLSTKDYVSEFNSRLDLLNDIIAKKNKTGLEYRVRGLTEDGRLLFETPSMPGATRSWTVNINPGQWRGEIEDIVNTNYYRSIPGLEMRNTSSGVFGDMIPRKGSGTYESINDYLKILDLGRIKPGFNSQTQYSRSAWENFIKSGRGVGYYSDPNTIYGIMKKPGGVISPDKAHEMLKDGTAHGKPLTDKQKRYFGYIYGSSKKQYGGMNDHLSVYPMAMNNGGISDPYFPNQNNNYTTERLSKFINLVKGSAQKALVKELEGFARKEGIMASGGSTPYQNGLTAGTGWLAKHGGSHNLPKAQYGPPYGFGVGFGRSSFYPPLNFNPISWKADRQLPEGAQISGIENVKGRGRSFNLKVRVPQYDQNLENQTFIDPTQQADPNQTPSSSLGTENPIDAKPADAPPTSYKEETIKFKRNPMLSGRQKVMLFNTGMEGITNFANRIDDAAGEEELRKRRMADNLFDPIQGNRGDYTANYGYFRPDQMVPVQFSGAAGSYAQYGGSQDDSVYMTEDEIQQILANGGEIEYLD